MNLQEDPKKTMLDTLKEWLIILLTKNVPKQLNFGRAQGPKTPTNNSTTISSQNLGVDSQHPMPLVLELLYIEVLQRSYKLLHRIANTNGKAMNYLRVYFRVNSFPQSSHWWALMLLWMDST